MKLIWAERNQPWYVFGLNKLKFNNENVLIIQYLHSNVKL